MTTVAVIGECMLELSSRGNSTNDLKLAYGGDTLNAAVYMSRLGLSVEYVTAIGDDPHSQAMRAFWQDEGIGTRLVQIVEKALPGLYMIETSDNGERSFYYWRDQSPARQLFDGNNASLIFAELTSFPYIYLSGITLSLYPEGALEKLWRFFELYKKQGGKIIFDSNYRPAGWSDIQTARKVISKMSALCDIALPSFADEQALYGDSDIEDCLTRYKATGTEEIVIKNAGAGCNISLNNKLHKLPPTRKVTPIDTTAAGDSFNGAYIAARLKGLDIVEAAKVGQRCAEAVILHPGALAPREATPSSLLSNN